MKRNKISNYLLFISIFSFITVFVYIVQKSYDNLMKPIETVKKSDLIKPVDPNFDISILDEIESRNYYQDETIIPTSTPTISL